MLLEKVSCIRNLSKTTHTHTHTHTQLHDTVIVSHTVIVSVPATTWFSYSRAHPFVLHGVLVGLRVPRWVSVYLFDFSITRYAAFSTQWVTPGRTQDLTLSLT